ncbi:MFS transporter [Microlunatus sp. Gsoil 973]|uniref:MFS transporter n=1 Tax=Microlunatus sp. Gsoil 973 TaxID=2672569 RepID=UPI0012B4F05F|nr:MFS transporter [Microlunatus sp. Gsoil 973]QGN34281.1 MFS transporter [Microlunatus sp. Gsoil 973]
MDGQQRAGDRPVGNRQVGGQVGHHRAPGVLLAVAGVLLVAACLRPAITSVGPVLDLIGSDVGLGHGAEGLLAALPLLAFAAVSPATHRLSRRVGIDRTVLAALLLLIVGIILRSVGVGGLLWLGTLLIGVAIAVNNVLVPAVVKRDFGNRIAAMTGAYTAIMNTFAAIASGIAVPLAGLSFGVPALHGWRTAVGIWVVLTVAGALVWAVRMRGSVPVQTVVPAVLDPAERHHSIWRSPLAWQVTLHMGLQSTVFYTLVNWLPSIEADAGVSPAVAGLHLFLYQAIGIGAALAASALMTRSTSQRMVAGLITVPILVALVGMLVRPELLALWAVLCGLTSGGSITVALALIGLRTRLATDTARLSGMAQGVGYLLAAGGPVAAGALRSLTGSWIPVIVMLIVLTLLQAVSGYLGGRNRYVGEKDENSLTRRRVPEDPT